MIIEAEDLDQSISSYEKYLEKKYKTVNYKARYDGDIRLPYPHELGQSSFINDNNEEIIISKNFADPNYYEETYLPHVKQNTVSIEEVRECIQNIKYRIYNTIVKTLISQEEQITKEKFCLILSYICDNKYSTENYLKYKITHDNNNFFLNILYKDENRWVSGSRFDYEHQDINDTFTIDVYTSNGVYPIDMDRIGKQKVI